MKKLRSAVLLMIFTTFFSVAISAQTASVKLEPFLSGLSSPVYLTNAGDGSNRLYIVEQNGFIKVVQPGSTAPTDFLNISSQISIGGERGLLGLAFHPQYAVNRRFFVYYTRAADGALEIAEYQTSANPLVANTTGKIIITIPHPDSNHNGGTIAFGADGFLYAGTGDGGGANDPSNNAQNINQLLGKFIRLNINPPAGSNAPYTVPADNPFVGIAGADEIYAVGFRNPYRWSFDRGGDNQLWAGDVGQNALEEADIVTRGGNFGWRVYEGNSCTNNDPALCTNPNNYIAPVFQYGIAGNDRCAITGGYVYRGSRGVFPNGAYIYGDYCTGEIFRWHNNQQTLLLDSTRFISSFGEDESGELYVVGLTSGTVERLAPLGTTAAKVTMGGRVMTAGGRGIRNVSVRLTDSNGNVRATTTTSFGYYRFTDVEVGDIYAVTVKGRRFTFNQSAQVFNLDDDMDNINFIANE